MDSPTLVNNIIAGTTTGVFAGLILFGFTYAKQYIEHRMRRREQVKYIRQIVEEFQDRILSAQQVISEHGAPPLTNIPDAVRKLRWAQLEYTCKEIARTLEGRADTLTFDEKKQVLDAFSDYNLFRPGGTFGDQGLLIDEAGYHQIFDKLEEIKWLKVRGPDRTAIRTKLP